jgi:hypothetical protein
LVVAFCDDGLIALRFELLPGCLLGFELLGIAWPGFDLPGLTSPALTFTGLVMAGASLVGAAVIALLAGLRLTIALAGTTMALLARVV